MLFGQVNSFRISLRKFDALGQRFIKLLQIIFDLQNKIRVKVRRREVVIFLPTQSYAKANNEKVPQIFFFDRLF